MNLNCVAQNNYPFCSAQHTASSTLKHTYENMGKRVPNKGCLQSTIVLQTSSHELANAESPRIRAVHAANEDSISIVDFGLRKLFREQV